MKLTARFLALFSAPTVGSITADLERTKAKLQAHADAKADEAGRQRAAAFAAYEAENAAWKEVAHADRIVAKLDDLLA